MGIPREIDLTKPKLKWQWLLALFIIVIALVLVVGIGFWIANKVKDTVAGPKGSKRRSEERRI